MYDIVIMFIFIYRQPGSGIFIKSSRFKEKLLSDVSYWPLLLAFQCMWLYGDTSLYNNCTLILSCDITLRTLMTICTFNA